MDKIRRETRIVENLYFLMDSLAYGRQIYFRPDAGCKPSPACKRARYRGRQQAQADIALDERRMKNIQNADNFH